MITYANQKEVNQLAIMGGKKVRKTEWPLWPKADVNTEKVLKNVLYSGRWAVSGPYKGKTSYERQFASEFAKYNGVAYCTPTTNGTSALSIALMALGIGPGDEVLVPGLTWVACASSVFCVGARPILVDIDLNNLAMSLHEAKKAITPNTKAIMVVHPFCRVADIDGFVELSKKYDIPLIEDCSQAHGALYKGKRVGSFGVIGCFSMQQSKVLTSGEGGAAITNDLELYKKMEQLRSDGRLFTNPRMNQLELIEVGDVLGQNMCLSEFQSAILYQRLPYLDEENAKRRKNAELLDRLLNEINGVMPIAQQDDSLNTYYNYVISIDSSYFSGISVDVIGRALSEELDINIYPIYKPLNKHILYNPQKSTRIGNDKDISEKFDPHIFSLPNADYARKTHISFPNHVLLDNFEGINDIVFALKKVQKQAASLREMPQGDLGNAF